MCAITLMAAMSLLVAACAGNQAPALKIRTEAFCYNDDDQSARYAGNHSAWSMSRRSRPMTRAGVFAEFLTTAGVAKNPCAAAITILLAMARNPCQFKERACPAHP